MINQKKKKGKTSRNHKAKYAKCKIFESTMLMSDMVTLRGFSRRV